MKTLEKIVPTPIRIDIAGERIELTPIKTLELPRLIGAVKPIFADVKGLLSKYKGMDDADLHQEILALVLEKSDVAIESIISACSVCARKPRAWVDALDIDELIGLFGKLLEVNGDFLAGKVLPAFAEMIEGLTEKVAGRN